MVKATIAFLASRQDIPWLKKRVGVIVFEECWPAASRWSTRGDVTLLTKDLMHISQCAKFKDAAGLGSLAYALHEKDRHVRNVTHDHDSLEYVSSMLDKPREFWPQMLEMCDSSEQRAIVDAARVAHSRAGWPWDRAFAIAAGFLATREITPNIPFAEPRDAEFPYWVAIDRHTAAGKSALRDTAKRLKISPTLLSWVSFYRESAMTNHLRPSPWWKAERDWRLGKVGVDKDKASEIWGEAQPVMKELLSEREAELRSRVARYLDTEAELGATSTYTSLPVQQATLLDALAPFDGGGVN